MYFMGWGSREGGNKKKLVYLKSRWSEYKIHCVKFPFKNYQFLIFSVFHGVRVTREGQQHSQAQSGTVRYSQVQPGTDR